MAERPAESGREAVEHRNTMHAVTRVLLFICGLGAVASPGLAQDRDLGDMSIEDLMNIEITSASRKEQRAQDIAAAVFVITHDDIRRSGMTTLPDLLRLAPGVDVAQINSNKWAVSVRGFNSLYANKLLVLVDGRSVYNRFFSGVFWDTEDLMLDDVERIEVIRGPGAAMWGANAVNGVINIVTRAAEDTQGGLVRVDGGRSGQQAALRYGGTVGGARYRVYSQWSGRDESLTTSGRRANDASHSVTTGFRADRPTPRGSWLLEGAFTAVEAHSLYSNLASDTQALEPYENDPSNTRSGHLVGRWTHTRAGGATLQIQSSVDLAARQESVGSYHRKGVDVDAQYHTKVGSRHDLVAGAAYRFIAEEFAGNVGYALTPPEDTSSLTSAFLQDEIGFFGDRLAITLGSQVQYDSDSGAGLQPTARAMWKAFPRQRLWAATSRALRTPSLYERGIRLQLPPVPTDAGLPLAVVLLGNAAAKTETLVDAEAGYRLEIGTTVTIGVTGFVGRYHRLQTQEYSDPLVELTPSPQLLATAQFANQLEATTRGLEVAGGWMPIPAWRIDGSYATFAVSPRLTEGSTDPAAATSDVDAPRIQWQLRSTISPNERATISLALFHVGRLEQLAVGSYTRTDASAEWRLTSHLSATVIGQNLFDAAHAEFSGDRLLLLATQVRRSASLRLRWAFR